MISKKAIELSINTIVILGLAVIVLLALVIFFGGGWDRLTDKLRELFVIPEVGIAAAKFSCDQICSSWESANCDNSVRCVSEGINDTCYNLFCSKCGFDPAANKYVCNDTGTVPNPCQNITKCNCRC